MSDWSSFKDDQSRMNAWRSFLDDKDDKLLTEQPKKYADSSGPSLANFRGPVKKEPESEADPSRPDPKAYMWGTSYGLNSPKNPGSLLLMLAKMQLSPEIANAIVAKVAELSDDENIVLEAVTLSGRGDETQRTFKPESTQELLNFLQSLNLGNNLKPVMKALNSWGNSNTVKFERPSGAATQAPAQQPRQAAAPTQRARQPEEPTTPTAPERDPMGRKMTRTPDGRVVFEPEETPEEPTPSAEEQPETPDEPERDPMGRKMTRTPDGRVVFEPEETSDSPTPSAEEEAPEGAQEEPPGDAVEINFDEFIDDYRQDLPEITEFFRMDPSEDREALQTIFKLFADTNDNPNVKFVMDGEVIQESVDYMKAFRSAREKLRKQGVTLNKLISVAAVLMKNNEALPEDFIKLKGAPKSREKLFKQVYTSEVKPPVRDKPLDPEEVEAMPDMPDEPGAPPRRDRPGAELSDEEDPVMFTYGDPKTGEDIGRIDPDKYDMPKFEKPKEEEPDFPYFGQDIPSRKGKDKEDEDKGKTQFDLEPGDFEQDVGVLKPSKPPVRKKRLDPEDVKSMADDSDRSDPKAPPRRRKGPKPKRPRGRTRYGGAAPPSRGHPGQSPGEIFEHKEVQRWKKLAGIITE